MVLFYVWYILINVILGGYAAYIYREYNGFVIAARVCGLPLNFNCILILILMLRKTLTLLRATYISQFLPLDHNILFHKNVGVFIGVLSGIHTGAHIGNAGMYNNSIGQCVINKLQTENRLALRAFGQYTMGRSARKNILKIPRG